MRHPVYNVCTSTLYRYIHCTVSNLGTSRPPCSQASVQCLYKVGHGLLVRVSELSRQNGDSCGDKNYGSTLDQFLGNFFHNFLSKIRKFIFHSFIHFSFIYDVSILIFHHGAIFLWLEFIFPMNTIKMKLKHQVTLQLRKCSCMILALPATFNELYHGSLLFNLFQNLGEHWINKDLCSQEKSRSKLKVHFSFLVVHSTHSGTNIPKVMKSFGFCLAYALQCQRGVVACFRASFWVSM